MRKCTTLKRGVAGNTQLRIPEQMPSAPTSSSLIRITKEKSVTQVGRADWPFIQTAEATSANRERALLRRVCG